MDIIFKQVGYTYSAQTPFEFEALKDVSFEIPEGSYTALIGHTGSGKSTLLQHLNALLKPTKGQVEIGDWTISKDSADKSLKALRKEVGVVFQFPESQLFEETVLKDIAFGPKNYGATEEEAEALARKMASRVGLSEDLLDRSPFDLSGGQKRRVAIAGVLALEPKILVLDEPTAGLDPKGRLEMMEMFKELHAEGGMTIVLVTHQMNDVAEYADRVIVLEKGEVIGQGSPEEIFSQQDWLQSKQLNVPDTVIFADQLADRLGIDYEKIPLTTDELVAQLVEVIPFDQGEVDYAK